MFPDILSRIPGPGARHVAVRVTSAAERALRQGHPWLFDRAIRQRSHDGRPGDLAVVFDRKRRFLAVGLYDPCSAIRVRVLQRGEPASIDRDWFRARLEAAVRLRAPLLGEDTNGYRLVHGESDGLPGLVVDRYDQTLVLKLYTAAWVPHLRDVIPALADVPPALAGVPPTLVGVPPAGRLVLRLGRAVQRQPGYLHGLRDGMVLSGPDLDGPVVFRENGLRFEADPIAGQKTGFFLDQRDNRARVGRLANGSAVLDAFAYTGGFSVYAARGGAREVVSLDVSRPALAAAARNFALNRRESTVAAARHELMAEDAFEALARLGRSGRRFDLVVVDPPAFARRQAQVARAVSAYGQLTRLALGVLRPGGTLVQASCSSQVDAEPFFAAVNEAAVQAGRPLREIERTGHPLDHPIGFPEGAYLKCLFATAP